MIVHEDDCSRILCNRLPEDFARMNQRGVQQSSCHRHVALEPVLSVEDRDVKLFDRKIFQSRREDLVNVAWTAHGDAILPFFCRHATAKLECSVDRDGPRGSDPVERCERGHRLRG